MRCEDVSDRLFDIASSDLVSKDAQVLAHIETCAECRAALTRAARAWSSLSAVPEAVPDSRAMRERFDALLHDQVRHRPSWWDAWRPMLAAAALFLMFAGGALVGRRFPAGGAGDANSVGALRRELSEVREMLTLSLMEQGMASERLKGVSAAARIGDPGPKLLTTVLDTLRHDPDVNVRLAAIRALERFRERPAVRQGIVRALARERSPLVTIALIDFVMDAKDDTAIDALRQLADDTARDDAVRETAAEGAEQLLGRGRT